MAADGLTLVTVITAGSREPGTAAHSRAWRIPPESAEAFAQAMTERAETNAEDGFLFSDRDVPDA